MCMDINMKDYTTALLLYGTRVFNCAADAAAILDYSTSAMIVHVVLGVVCCCLYGAKE